MRISRRFEELQAANQAALVCFVTAGDPEPGVLPDLISAIASGGADAIEVGIPFSDPLADGPSIQASSQRALAAGMNSRLAMAEIAEARRRLPDLPIVVMTYFNPVLRFGMEAWAAAAASAGVDGHIVTDLSPEESAEWRAVSARHGLDTIFLVAPTSTDERAAIVAELCTGFVYGVSRTGVTGARQKLSDEVGPMVARMRRFTQLPVCVGFGVSSADQAGQVAAMADGVVVGSALVDLIHQRRDDAGRDEAVSAFVRELKSGCIR
ncbi:MAG: tryptophan synthase subunit alpha [Armatimonadetes bacterium]|nr:tryptophan synthase subunit alpha [Armatimonadota bacterium]MDE2207658.1 tryptophan synthase subunit alpha [Armatimonadota bacterium]